MVRIEERRDESAAHGAPLCGAVPLSRLTDPREAERILPGAKTVVVLAAPHSRSAIESANIQVAQYDTILADDEAARASRAVALWLERRGHRAAAVPAFIPVDMAPPKRGMEGAVDWRAAAVAAGIGGYGESGLLVTAPYGPAVRLGGVVTEAVVTAEEALPESPCLRCQAACPVVTTPHA